MDKWKTVWQNALTLTQQFALPTFANLSVATKVILIVESRPFDRMRYFKAIIRHCLQHFFEEVDDTALVFVSFASNVESVQQLIENLSCNAKNHFLPHQKIDSVNDYNNLMLSADFWQFLRGKKVLMLQHDSCVLSSLKPTHWSYDNIGGAWPARFKIAPPENMGNGGLCVRSVDAMLAALETFDCSDLAALAPTVKRCMREQALDRLPEDVYYACAMQKNGCKLAPRAEALRFSVESVFDSPTNDPIGYHQPWHSHNNERWLAHIARSLDDYTFFFCHIEKCGGTTLREAIYKVFGKRRGASRCFVPQHTAKASATLQDASQFSVFAYHTNYYDFIAQCKQKRLFSTTLLRDPVERIISHYHAFDIVDGRPLDTFSDDELSAYCKTIGHLTVRRLGADATRRNETLVEMFVRAKKTIGLMQVVGFLDHLDVYCEQLSEAIGQRFALPPPRNVNAQKQKYSADLRKRIASKIVLEQALIDHAKRLHLKHSSARV